jgi:hypothetical protein
LERSAQRRFTLSRAQGNPARRAGRGRPSDRPVE